MPIGLANLSWRMYMINASWDVIIVVLIVSLSPPSVYVFPSLLTVEAVFWVETKGKTLEEIDAIFEGAKHSDVPDVEAVRRGEETIDVAAIEKQLTAELGGLKNEAGVTSGVKVEGPGERFA